MLQHIFQLYLKQVSQPILPVRIHAFSPPIIPSVQLPTHFFASPFLNVSLSFSRFLSNNKFIGGGGSVGKNKNLYRILVGKLELKK